MLCCCYCSVTKSCPTLWSYGLQHARLLGPSLSPRVHSNSCPLWWWCYLTFSSSATPFSFAFNISQIQGLFQWLRSFHQVAKVLELQLQHQSFQWIFQGWFPLGLTGLISLQSSGCSRVLQHHDSKASILWLSAFLMVQLSYSYMATKKTIPLTMCTFVGKVMSPL